MFVNCPFCRGLVATDPVTDRPPERCPRCAGPLRDAPGSAPAPADDARSGVAAAMAEAFGNLDDAAEGGGAADPARDRAAQPVISLADLLQDAPEPVPEPEPVSAPASQDGASTQTRSDAAARDAAFEAAADTASTPGNAGTPTPPQPDAPADREAPSDPPPDPLPGPPSDPARSAAVAAAGPTPGAPAAARPRRTTPSFARSRHTSPDATAGRRWPLPAAIAGLALLLGLQWLLADRARLAADPGWRPLVSGACAVLRCSLPPWREPTAFALLDRDVRPHPEADGALRITASFRNDAAWPQAWPEVVLTLSDIDGRPLGARAFAAADYLGGEPPTALIDSGQGAVIRMDVVEPGPGAVGFAFDFR